MRSFYVVQSTESKRFFTTFFSVTLTLNLISLHWIVVCGFFISATENHLAFGCDKMWEFSQDSVTEQLKVDQALLNITSTLYENLWLYQLSDECVAVRFSFAFHLNDAILSI